VVTPTKVEPVKMKLVVVDGPDFGREFPLTAGTYRLGSDEGCELALKDTAISRVHRMLAVTTEGVKLTDQGSTNGSICNGVGFSAILAKEGALIQVGRSTLKLMPQTEVLARLAPSNKNSFGTLTGKSLTMRRVFAVLERIAPTDTDVLIRGETGTGKELCARSIHDQSARKTGPFVVCDLSVVNRSLVESELFGHVKGAFTGATADRVGAFQRANGGTLFLDEVGELPLELQTVLLRALERREVKRLGGDVYETVDVRVVAATHRDLTKALAENSFREDIYHRLARAEVVLPPLRDRPEDIPLLVNDIVAALGKSETPLDPQTRALLAQHTWPGNVRELRNVVERAMTLGAGPAVDSALESRVSAASSAEAAGLSFKKAKERIVDAFERDYLVQVLERCGWNLTQAAKEAGIDRYYVRQLVKKHQLKKK
jgi:two-component system, NtrC family, nitrogen regulation response regulator GlnG